jgi:hypothetical protein
MARRVDTPDETNARQVQGDRILTALMVLAAGTFLAAIVWLLLGSR